MNLSNARVALLGLCVLATPFLSFAQNTASFTSNNVAEASLEQAVTRAVEAEFSPVLLAQAQPAPQTPQTPRNPQAPSLGDLGFPTADTQGNAAEQARLDRRSHMLKVHQRLGLITTIPLAATLFSSGLASGKSTSSTGRDLHASLGTVTAGMYLTTAYYSIFAPKVPGTTTKGSVRLHKTLAFIHGPGMILTPILGAIAFEQKSRGERGHGIASAHEAVAATTAIAYGLPIASASFKF
jgi:hypothetical protein